MEIKSLKDAVVDNGLKVLVHGQAGAGKTVLCATTGSPTLIISAEAGLLSIRDAPDYIKTVEVTSITDIEQVFELLDKHHEFEWICLDSVSEIAEVVLSHEKELNKDGRIYYVNMMDKMSRLIRNFRDLPKYNVVMTAKQQMVEDPASGIMMYMPSMPGKSLANNVPYWFDEVFALRVEQDEDGDLTRVLQTSRDIQYEAKDRSGKLDKFEKPKLQHILEKING